MRPKGEDPSLCSEVEHRGFLMAAGRDYQSSGSPQVCQCVLKAIACYVTTKVSVLKPQLNPAKAFMTLMAFPARLIQSRASGPKVKWVSSVTPRILGVLFSGTTLSLFRTCG